ncbi:MAG: hypothetical protein R6U95_03440 [Bacteroidales bacterium]
MKNLLVYIGIIIGVSISSTAYSQTVIPKESDIDPTAALKVTSPTSNKGVLFPTLSTIQMYSIVKPATGLLLFNTDRNQFMYFNGSVWSPITHIIQTNSTATTGISEGELRFYSTATDSSLMFLDDAGTWQKLTTSGNTIP